MDLKQPARKAETQKKIKKKERKNSCVVIKV